MATATNPESAPSWWRTDMPRKPNPASSYIQIRVTPAMLEAVKARAEADGYTMSEWLKRLIEKALDK